MEEQGATTFERGVAHRAWHHAAGRRGGGSSIRPRQFNMRGSPHSLFWDGVRDYGRSPRRFPHRSMSSVPGADRTDVGAARLPLVNADKTPTRGPLTPRSSVRQCRRSGCADANWRGPCQANSWLIRVPSVHVLWADTACLAETSSRSRARFRPPIKPASELTRVTLGAHIVRRQTVPDYGIPGEPCERTCYGDHNAAPAPVDPSISREFGYVRRGRARQELHRRIDTRQPERDAPQSDSLQPHTSGSGYPLCKMRGVQRLDNLVSVARRGRARNKVTRPYQPCGPFLNCRLRRVESRPEIPTESSSLRR